MGHPTHVVLVVMLGAHHLILTSHLMKMFTDPLQQEIGF